MGQPQSTREALPPVDRVSSRQPLGCPRVLPMLQQPKPRRFPRILWQVGDPEPRKRSVCTITLGHRRLQAREQSATPELTAARTTMRIGVPSG
jgi:hypothetical protein